MPTTGSGRARPAAAPRSMWLDAEEQRAWRAYLAGSKLLDAALDDDVQRHGLRLEEYEILALLSESDGGALRMSVLAGQVVQSRSRLTHTAGRLEQRGLVARRPAEHDRRGVDIHLTPAGRTLLDQVSPYHVASVRRHLLDHLGREQFIAFGEAMAAIRDGILADPPDSTGATP